MSDPPNDRRRQQRHLLWFPVQLRTSGGQPVAVAHDINTLGMQLVADEPMAVGSRVRLSFEVPTQGGLVHNVEGTVVRVVDNDGDNATLFPHRIAVEFSERTPALDEALQKAAKAGPAGPR